MNAVGKNNIDANKKKKDINQESNIVIAINNLIAHQQLFRSLGAPI